MEFPSALGGPTDAHTHDLPPAYGDALPETEPERKPRYWLHILLFCVTLVTTTLAGLEWMSPAGSKAIQDWTLTWGQFSQGFQFSLPFLGILTVHEFGHYFMARRYRAKVTLPFYIPMWLGWLGSLSIGTMGAFIRINSPFKTRKQLFDVGAAGPLAGYVAILCVLVYAYTHLPPADFIFTIHPEYLPFGPDYAKYVYLSENLPKIALGNNLTTYFLSKLAEPGLMPNAFEMMHYPFVFAGFMALFFTALNLFPIGQLDGGHILYGLVGPEWHRRLSPLLFIALVMYSGLGMAQPMLGMADPEGSDKLQWNVFYLAFLLLTFSKTVPGFMNILMLAISVFGVQYALAVYAPSIQGYNGWLVFCFVLGRFLGIYHPPTLYDEPLSAGRKAIGLIAILVFVLCFSPQPFIFE